MNDRGRPRRARRSANGCRIGSALDDGEPDAEPAKPGLDDRHPCREDGGGGGVAARHRGALRPAHGGLGGGEPAVELVRGSERRSHAADHRLDRVGDEHRDEGREAEVQQRAADRGRLELPDDHAHQEEHPELSELLEGPELLVDIARQVDHAGGHRGEFVDETDGNRAGQQHQDGDPRDASDDSGRRTSVALVGWSVIGIRERAACPWIIAQSAWRCGIGAWSRRAVNGSIPSNEPGTSGVLVSVRRFLSLSNEAMP